MRQRHAVPQPLERRRLDLSSDGRTDGLKEWGGLEKLRLVGERASERRREGASAQRSNGTKCDRTTYNDEGEGRGEGQNGAEAAASGRVQQTPTRTDTAMSVASSFVGDSGIK